MSKLQDLYSSFDEFFSSFFRGNEVEFFYRGEHFCIIPLYDDRKNVTGVCFGKANDETGTICMSKSELYNSKIGDTFFGNVLQEIEIVWNNF